MFPLSFYEYLVRSKDNLINEIYKVRLITEKCESDLKNIEIALGDLSSIKYFSLAHCMKRLRVEHLIRCYTLEPEPLTKEEIETYIRSNSQLDKPNIEATIANLVTVYLQRILKSSANYIVSRYVSIFRRNTQIALECLKFKDSTPILSNNLFQSDFKHIIEKYIVKKSYKAMKNYIEVIAKTHSFRIDPNNINVTLASILFIPQDKKIEEKYRDKRPESFYSEIVKELGIDSKKNKIPVPPSDKIFYQKKRAKRL